MLAAEKVVLGVPGHCEDGHVDICAVGELLVNISSEL